MTLENSFTNHAHHATIIFYLTFQIMTFIYFTFILQQKTYCNYALDMLLILIKKIRTIIVRIILNVFIYIKKVTCYFAYQK